MEDPGESSEIKYSWHLRLVWGISKLGHCPPEEPSLLTPDDGELPPRGLTPNSERDHFHVVFLSLAISILRLSP